MLDLLPGLYKEYRMSMVSYLGKIGVSLHFLILIWPYDRLQAGLLLPLWCMGIDVDISAGTRAKAEEKDLQRAVQCASAAT
jgi:hypothetical protein